MLLCTMLTCNCHRETGSRLRPSTACFLTRNPDASWKARNGGQQRKPSVSYKMSLHRAGNYKNEGVSYGDIRYPGSGHAGATIAAEIGGVAPCRGTWFTIERFNCTPGQTCRSLLRDIPHH